MTLTGIQFSSDFEARYMPWNSKLTNTVYVYTVFLLLIVVPLHSSGNPSSLCMLVVHWRTWWFVKLTAVESRSHHLMWITSRLFFVAHNIRNFFSNLCWKCG